MDLTNPRRALSSLSRRNDNQDELAAAQVLLEIITLDSVTDAQTFNEAVKLLLKSQKWESRASCYLGLKVILEKHPALMSNEFLECLFVAFERDFEHIEPRIRTSCIQILSALGSFDGVKTWNRIGENILNSVKKNLYRSSQERLEAVKEVYHFEMPETKIREVELAHQTMGWKSLETSLQAIEKFVLGMGNDFVSMGYVTNELLDLIFKECLFHENRYVREVGYDLCSALVTPIYTAEYNQKEEFMQMFVEGVSRGLADNWSQVRFAASVAARKICELDQRDSFLELLLPKMCLNRYYLAEGVKIYSQETWKLCFGKNGAFLVAKFIKNVVEYYISQSKADNHAVREAACYCIAELATKLNIKNKECAEHTVQEFVPDLLEALVNCFKDESWPVRDAACLASAKFISGFPNESLAVVESDFLELWLSHLSDNIWSVREDSAIALGIVLATYSPLKAASSELKVNKPSSVVENEGSAVLGSFLKSYKPKIKKLQKEKKVSPFEKYKTTDGVFNPVLQILTAPQQLLKAVYSEKRDENSGKVTFVEFDLSDSKSVASSSILSEDDDQLKKYHKRESKPNGVVTGYISELTALHEYSKEVMQQIQTEGGNVEDEPILKYTNQQRFSCGSLAPKLKRGVGCMDHGFSRKKKQWEITDGGIYLVREISKFDSEIGSSYLESVAEICKTCRFFIDYEKLVENVWKNLPHIAQSTGKRLFKKHLEFFLSTLMQDCQHDNKLIANSATKAAIFLDSFLGHEIFLYRIKNSFQGEKLLNIFNSICSNTQVSSRKFPASATVPLHK